MKNEVFHSVTMKLLYIMKRERPDLEMAMSYLCTRVSRNTFDYWKKLRRTIVFVKCMIDDKRIIEVDDMYNICMWIDDVYAVKSDMKCQTVQHHL